MGEKKNVHQRIADAMKAVPYIQKTGTNMQTKKKYVSHDHVVATLRAALLDAGVGFTIEFLDTTTVREIDKKETFTEIKARCWFFNIDDPEDKTFIDALGQGIDMRDLAAGKAESYVKKYALLNKLLLETGEADPEYDSMGYGENGNGKDKPPQSNSAPPPQTQHPAQRKSVVPIKDQFSMLCKGLYKTAMVELQKKGLPIYNSVEAFQEAVESILTAKPPHKLTQGILDYANDPKNRDAFLGRIVENAEENNTSV